jgi:hypothetical protein
VRRALVAVLLAAVLVPATPAAAATAAADCWTLAVVQPTYFGPLVVYFAGYAYAVPDTPGVRAVSSSFSCYLRNQAAGSATGIWAGPVAAAYGTGHVYRLAPNPEICAAISVVFSDGTTVGPTTTCKPIDGLLTG